jgi:serine/threonine protein kinase
MEAEKEKENYVKVKDYLLMDKIGKGAFGEVFSCIKTNINSSKIKEELCIKVISKEKIEQHKLMNNIQNELNILKILRHENIVTYKTDFKTINNLYVVLERYNGGCLTDLIKKIKLTELEIQHIMIQITRALYYLKENNILHRDLKCDNIMINYENEEDRINNNILNGTIKIIDFGFARILKEGDLATSKLGSPITQDPTILNFTGKYFNETFLEYDERVDLWSIGVICFQLYHKDELPFPAKTKIELIEKVNKGDYSIVTNNKISCEFISFINCLLKFNFMERIKIEDLIRHKFLVMDTMKFNYLNENKKKNSLITISLNAKKDKLNDLISMIVDKDELQKINNMKMEILVERSTILDDNTKFKKKKDIEREFSFGKNFKDMKLKSISNNGNKGDKGKKEVKGDKEGSDSESNSYLNGMKIMNLIGKYEKHEHMDFEELFEYETIKQLEEEFFVDAEVKVKEKSENKENNEDNFNNNNEKENNTNNWNPISLLEAIEFKDFI